MAGGLLSVALSGDRSPWALPSVLPCGARTFLSAMGFPSGAATTWPAFPKTARGALLKTEATRQHPILRLPLPLQQLLPVVRPALQQDENVPPST